MPVLGKVLSYVGRALSGGSPAPSEGARALSHGAGHPAVPALMRLTVPAGALRGPPAPAPTVAPSSLRPGGVLTEAEARAVHERWKSQGDYVVSGSGRCRMTSGYQSWKQRVELFLAHPPGEVRDQVEGWRRWLGEHELHARWLITQKGMAPRVAGPVPFDLAAQIFEGEPLGAPPIAAFRPIHVFSVKLPGGSRYSFHDDPVQLGEKGPIHEAGVARIGVKLHKHPDLEGLLTDAGLADATERKVMKKIAEMERGFEAINTCDPNDVSVGFVPFAAGETGDGPLSRLLRGMKSADPVEFDSYFRGLGIDVGERGLTVVHPEDGRLLRGREAVHAIRDDKRLTAVFQNAGEKSRAYQLAQLRLARAMYYLASQDFTLKCLTRAGDRALVITLSGRYGEVLRSEAGKLAIMDRAVHRGLGNAQQVFKEACTSVIQEKGITTLRALAEYEALITPLVQPPGRIRVMEDKDLSQPTAAPEL
jgi:hypothetical protein